MITYGAAAWYEPELGKPNKVIRAISKIQASGIRVVAGAYRATPIRELEAETYTPLVDIYCVELRARQIRKIYTSLAGAYIQEQCRMISNRL